MELSNLGSFASDFWKIIIVKYLLISDINNLRMVNKFYQNLIKTEFPNWKSDLKILKKMFPIRKFILVQPLLSSNRCYY